MGDGDFFYDNSFFYVNPRKYFASPTLSMPAPTQLPPWFCVPAYACLYNNSRNYVPKNSQKNWRYYKISMKSIFFILVFIGLPLFNLQCKRSHLGFVLAHCQEHVQYFCFVYIPAHRHLVYRFQGDLYCYHLELERQILNL